MNKKDIKSAEQNGEVFDQSSTEDEHVHGDHVEEKSEIREHQVVEDH